MPRLTTFIEELGDRYLELPLEIVGQMLAADFGVLMAEILPKGYLSPGSFTNDGRYRVSELAAGIRRNGVERPLRIYMGPARPAVWDGHHRYAAAEIARAARLPLEITYLEDLPAVTRWARTTRGASASSALPRPPGGLAADGFPSGPAARPRPADGAGSSSRRSAHVAGGRPAHRPRAAKGPR